MIKGSDVFQAKLNLEVQRADLTSIAAVERVGGKIRTAYYDLESLKVAAHPEKWCEVVSSSFIHTNFSGSWREVLFLGGSILLTV